MRPEFRVPGTLSCPVPYSLQESGFTRGTRNPLVCPTPGNSEPQLRTLEANSAPKGQIIGSKARSGFVNNMPNFQRLGNTLQDPQRFLTHYQSTFCNVASFRMNG
ncbi:hypothetical protein SKAU_G00281220 [Synaphobranchus kaupii]|uniref:Uncharacterized protein n=1 Tax=Synaphobranchus kaupii TaxID=118154 RepID=A0A9Q1INQ1_SYNKA|nr:hypothetical protein SKAU_G00281220 [Synaphobranchus kaupii]